MKIWILAEIIDNPEGSSLYKLIDDWWNLLFVYNPVETMMRQQGISGQCKHNVRTFLESKAYVQFCDN